MKKRIRDRKHPRKGPTSWRPPVELHKRLKGFDQNLNQAHERAVDYVFDALDALGPAGQAMVEMRAYEYQIAEGKEVTEGQALGRLAKEALEALDAKKGGKR